MRFATSVAIVLVATMARALAQSSGCTSSITYIEFPNSACEVSTEEPPTLTETLASEVISLNTCCPNLVGGQDDARRLFGLAPSDTLNSRALQTDETCRQVIVRTPYCDLEQGTGCTAESSELEIELAFDYSAVTSEETCCSECFCWGDPRCSSFDGTRANWIVCDDRRRSNCRHGPQRCSNQLDPWGDSCEFVKRTRQGTDNPWEGWDTDGSPCQSTRMYDGTEFPSMEFFSGDDFEVNLVLGERGVTEQVDLTVGSDTFSLTASACLADTSASVWTTDASNIPDTWTVTTESSQRVMWSVQNTGASVFTDILCQRTVGERSRLDVTLRYPTAGDSPDDEFTGFCVTGVISEDEKGTGTLSIEDDDKCLRMEIGGCLEACKALVDPTCVEENYDANVLKWCEENDYSGVTPAIGSDEECVERIKENCEESGFSWAQIVCQIDNMNGDGSGYDEDGYLRCLQDIEDFTWFQYVKDRPSFEVTSATTQTPTECIADVTEYNETKSNTCEIGVQVQSFNDDTSTWEDEFFIPSTLPPCDGIAKVNGTVFPNLMVRPIRLAQCESIQSECATSNNCLPTNGFTAQIEYRQIEECPTPAPTPVPEPTCYDCEEFAENQSPQVCQSSTEDFVQIGTCETCCEPDDEDDLPELSEWGYCRTQETIRPYCDADNDDEKAYCRKLKNKRNRVTLDINISYANPNEEPYSCCRDCSIYGDPEMTPFTATGNNLAIDAWIICDGREIPGDGSTCPIKSTTCGLEKDHDGNYCVYNETRASMLTDQSDIGAVGSPCQANPLSGEAVMEVYTTADNMFSINAVLGERAVVTETRLTVDGDTVSLVASECFGDAGSGWSDELSNSLTDVSYDAVDQRSTNRGAERTWKLTYQESIFIQITCLKMIGQKGGAKGVVGYRMNIDHIIDIDEERATSEDSTGYCPKGVVDFQLSTPTDTSDGSVFAECTWQQWSEGLTMAKALVGTATTSAQILDAITEWCQTANTNEDTPEACYDDIVDGRTNYNVIGRRWAKRYCRAISSNRPSGMSVAGWIDNCYADIREETFGIVSYVESYGTGEKNTINTCLSNPTYTTSDDTCTEGIHVEHYDTSAEDWVQSFFVPSTNLPCDGIITVKYADYPELFTNKIRFRQCDQPANNGCTLAESCMPAQGFDILYRFSQPAAVCN
ncbi:Hypothetical Protein FCC1311_022382 [Hondaea fermentalgiana]|uniref:Uncharacterized protein n=1 Tax=Hondaea fermentalgiana TaxID=2315210 RepID=A0A2R5G8A4_9STRA|nr:Hypothetical Protein FCC1311_022382 [Hondaea fermentalgiana]|eukprot:GBG26018.1 Hypothetical Protein FCC1311_022382 [Hondaea fermentalgiana]